MYKMSKRSFAGRLAIFIPYVICWTAYATAHYLAAGFEWLEDKGDSMMESLNNFANKHFPLG